MMERVNRIGLLVTVLGVVLAAAPTVASQAPDAAMAFLVQDGRIQGTPAEFSRYAGMPVGGFLDELRSLLRARWRTRLEQKPSA